MKILISVGSNVILIWVLSDSISVFFQFFERGKEKNIAYFTNNAIEIKLLLMLLLHNRCLCSKRLAKSMYRCSGMVRFENTHKSPPEEKLKQGP